LLLIGAALGDRFGRRRMFTIGLSALIAGAILVAVFIRWEARGLGPQAEGLPVAG
jgi:MFS family permease